MAADWLEKLTIDINDYIEAVNMRDRIVGAARQEVTEAKLRAELGLTDVDG